MRAPAGTTLPRAIRTLSYYGARSNKAMAFDNGITKNNGAWGNVTVITNENAVLQNSGCVLIMQLSPT